MANDGDVSMIIKHVPELASSLTNALPVEAVRRRRQRGQGEAQGERHAAEERRQEEDDRRPVGQHADEQTGDRGPDDPARLALICPSTMPLPTVASGSSSLMKAMRAGP